MFIIHHLYLPLGYIPESVQLARSLGRKKKSNMETEKNVPVGVISLSLAPCYIFADVCVDVRSEESHLNMDGREEK